MQINVPYILHNVLCYSDLLKNNLVLKSTVVQNIASWATRLAGQRRICLISAEGL